MTKEEFNVIYNMDQLPDGVITLDFPTGKFRKGKMLFHESAAKEFIKNFSYTMYLYFKSIKDKKIRKTVKAT